MSIGKAQAQALAEGFLNNLGDSKDGLAPRETLTEFFLLAGELIESAQKNLNQSHSNASGKLSASLKASEPQEKGTIVSVDVTMDFYGKFVNSGVKGTKSGSSNKGYSFKNDRPGEKMVKAIAEWQKGGKARVSNTNAKKSVSGNEKKNASISAIDSAYAIARSIKQKGIAKTAFIDRAVAVTSQKVKDRLGAALKIDIINSISP